MYQKLFQLHAKLLKALANSKRLEVIQLLRGREMRVGEMQEMLSLPQANLSQHLQVLRRSGVVKTRRFKREIYYSVSHKNFTGAGDLFRQILIERYKNEVADVIFKKMTDLVPLTSDPVCKMRLSPKTSAFAYRKNGREFFFCGLGCFEKFKINPGKFLKQAKGER